MEPLWPGHDSRSGRGSDAGVDAMWGSPWGVRSVRKLVCGSEVLAVLTRVFSVIWVKVCLYKREVGRSMNYILQGSCFN